MKTEVFHIRISGDPFRSVASVELMASLVCVLAFALRCQANGQATIAISGSTYNQGSAFLGDHLMVTQYPLYLVHMELTKQLQDRKVVLNVAWRPGDENQEAGVVTNMDFHTFDTNLRVQVKWADLRLLVLPELSSAAEDLHTRLQQIKKSGDGVHAVSSKCHKRGSFRVRDFW
jgi:hypothetical protein